MTADLIIADVFDGIASLPDNSVDLVMTSPPFLALRSYLPADHPDKAKEIGSEATPADFLDTLLDVVEAITPKLTRTASVCFELGDTYSGSGGAGGDYGEDGLREGAPKFNGSARAAKKNPRRDKGEDIALGIVGTTSGDRAKSNPDAWPLDKSLCGIPTLFAWSLAYGRNLLRPERLTPHWRIRNVIVWARPNPPVGALGDKFRPATSYLIVACKARDRWFDMDAVRTEHAEHTVRYDHDSGYYGNPFSTVAERGDGGNMHGRVNPAGAPLLDYWEIPTQPYRGAHYATWPERLVVPVVLSMCPERVCQTCGEPSRRIVNNPNANSGYDKVTDKATRHAAYVETVHNTIGWTDCDCSDDRNPSMGLLGKWRPGVVLDPFCGSGTTLQVATRLGRDAVGIDIDPRNEKLICDRVGLFMGDVRKVG